MRPTGVAMRDDVVPSTQATRYMEVVMVIRGAQWILWLIAMVLSWSAPARAGDADWVADMPAPAQVLAKIHGSDPFDTAARQYAALEQLIAVVRDRVGTRAFHNKVAPQESRLMRSYAEEGSRIQKALIESLPPAERTGADSRRARWFGLAAKYRADPAFDAALLDMFFSKGFQAQQAGLRAKSQESARAGQALLTAERAKLKTEFDAEVRRQNTSATRAFIEKVVPQQWWWATNPWLWCAVFAAIFVLGVALAVGRFGLAADDPFTLQVGARRYALHGASGLVTDVQRWTEGTAVPTTHTVTHYDGSQSTVHGTATRLDNCMQIMLRDSAGQTQDIRLWNMDLSIAAGQGFAAVWSIRKGSNTGPYVMLHNHDLARTQFIAQSLRATVHMPFWPAWPLAAALLCAGAAWWIALAAFAGYGVLAAVVSKLRVRRFEKDLTGRVLVALPKPPEGIVLPGGGMLAPG